MFFTRGCLARRSVKFTMKFVRKITKIYPLIAFVLQCLIGLSSVPSFMFRNIFSALSLSLYRQRTLKGSASRLLSRMKILQVHLFLDFLFLLKFFAKLLCCDYALSCVVFRYIFPILCFLKNTFVLFKLSLKFAILHVKLYFFEFL